jgi:hypothetical protein
MLAVVAVALTIRVIAKEPVPAPPPQPFLYSYNPRAVGLPGQTMPRNPAILNWKE